MLVSRAFTRLGLIAALMVPSAGAVVACGGSQKEVVTIPKPGDMPEGGDWTGVFFSPTYGHLHLIQQGSVLSGKWRTVNGDKWGEMHGEVTGNLFRYEWKETKIGMVGPSAVTTGRGYFQYKRPPGELVNDEIHGQWGLSNEQTGVTWDAVKQRNAKPDPDSVMPDETQKLEGGGWDGEKKKPGGGGDEKKSDEWN